MSMKLSRRDKAIILVAIVIVIAIAGYLVLLKPKYEEVQASNDRLASKEAERADVEAKIGTLEDLKKRLKDDVDNIVKDQKEFISEEEIFDPQQISTYLMDLFEPSGIEITGMDVPRLERGTLTAYTYNKNALAYEMKINADLAHELPDEVYSVYTGSYPAVPPSVIIGLSTVTVSFTFTEELQLLDAVQQIADNDKDIYLINVSSNRVIDPNAGEQDLNKGTMTIEFYTIYPLDPADIDKNPTIAETDE